MGNLAATDRLFDRKLTPVCVHPSIEYLTSGDHTMQTQPVPLTIGADVAKDQIVVACEEQLFAPHAIANRRPAVPRWWPS